jgi:hypothetical protein
MEYLVDFLRADGDSDRILSGAVDDRGDQSAYPQTTGFILAPGGTRAGGDGDFFSHTDLWVKRIDWKLVFAV